MGIAQREPLSIRSKPLIRQTGSVAARRSRTSLQPMRSPWVGSSPPSWGAVATGEGLTLANLAGKVDVAAETQRLEAELAKNDKELARCHNKLGNARFVERAPEAVVTEERRRLAEFERRRDELQAAHQRLAELEGAP